MAAWLGSIKRSEWQHDLPEPGMKNLSPDVPSIEQALRYTLGVILYCIFMLYGKSMCRSCRLSFQFLDLNDFADFFGDLCWWRTILNSKHIPSTKWFTRSGKPPTSTNINQEIAIGWRSVLGLSLSMNFLLRFHFHYPSSNAEVTLDQALAAFICTYSEGEIGWTGFA